MVERCPQTAEDALFRVRNGIDIKDYEKFQTLGYIGCDELTQEQLDKLQALNIHLIAYEKEIKKQVESVMDYALKKVNDPNNWIEQFDDIEVVISFFLAEDDHCYRDDCDNILMHMTQDFFENRTMHGIDDGENHNDFNGWTKDKVLDKKAHAMCNDYHCWIFHSLYDHTQLQWEEILRIGSIDVDVKLSLNRKNRDAPR